jgi:hypothetical protein
VRPQVSRGLTKPPNSAAPIRDERVRGRLGELFLKARLGWREINLKEERRAERAELAKAERKAREDAVRSLDRARSGVFEERRARRRLPWRPGFAARVVAHPPSRKYRLGSCRAVAVLKFACLSPLEGDGFELPVREHRAMASSHGFAAASHREAALRGAPASHHETAFRGAAGFREARRDAVHPSEMRCSAAVQAARYRVARRVGMRSAHCEIRTNLPRRVLIWNVTGTSGTSRMLPVYAARIADLGRGDFLKVDCAACHYVPLLTPEALLRLGLSPPRRFSTSKTGSGAAGAEGKGARWSRSSGGDRARKRATLCPFRRSDALGTSTPSATAGLMAPLRRFPNQLVVMITGSVLPP